MFFYIGQQRELQRLELVDLRSRYGATQKRDAAPSVFIIAIEDEEIIG